MFPRFNQLRQSVPARARDEAQKPFSLYQSLDAMDHDPVKRGKAFNSVLVSTYPCECSTNYGDICTSAMSGAGVIS
jgi:hypothetical protein